MNLGVVPSDSEIPKLRWVFALSYYRKFQGNFVPMLLSPEYIGYNLFT